MGENTIKKDSIYCPWCDNKMNRGSVTYADLSSMFYFCPKCGATLSTFLKEGKKIVKYKVSDFEYKDLNEG